MGSGGFETTIPTIKQLQTYALDGSIYLEYFAGFYTTNSNIGFVFFGTAVLLLCRHFYYCYTVKVNYYYTFYPFYWLFYTCILMLILQLASDCEVST
jgi:hypothetical protein